MPAFAETLTSGRIQADLTDIVASAAGTPAAAGAPFGYKTPRRGGAGCLPGRTNITEIYLAGSRDPDSKTH